jgi:beta-glucosidase
MRSPEAVLQQMTLEEKAALLTGDSAWTTPALPRIGLPSLRMADGPHGVRRTQSSGSMAFGAHAATCFPTASSTSSTWDPGLLREVGRAVAREAIALEVDVVLGPGVNMKRSPLCGRNFEYFSEDPHLAGRLAAAWIEGVQSLGVGASIKHFAVNNQETRRMSVSADVDERALREIYLPAFEYAIREARPWTVMCAYNRINGTYASEHHMLLTEVLRDEWSFDGFVVSDWAAVHDRPRAVAAGLDLEMPGPRPRRVRSVVEAVQQGLLAEEDVDQAVLRVLRVIERASATTKGAPFDAADHHTLARRVAAEGMVLLKNEGLLPLKPGGRLAVIGHAAKEPRIQGGGSSQITPTKVDIPLEELALLAGNAMISYAEGYDEGGAGRPELIEEAVALAAESDVAIVYVSLPVAKESEGGDRTDLDLTAQQVALIRAVGSAQPRTVVVLFNGSAIALAPWVDEVSAVLEAWLSGQAAGGAVADILFGVVNPSGRLAETFPVRVEDTPAYLNFPGDGDHVSYGEGLFIGYRWYDARRVPVMYPFGYGLSYTTFAYGNARASEIALKASDGVTIAVDVTNTGDRAGSEVVQVYVRDVEASVQRPEKELRGFAKVQLAPGECRTVEVHLDHRAFAYWDPRAKAWVTEAGEFEILIGSSSADIKASIPVTISDTTKVPSTLSEMSPLQDWLEDAEGRKGALNLLKTLAPILGGVFGEAVDHPDDLDPHFHSFFSTMPIRDLLEFAEPAGGPEPEARLKELSGSLRGATS